MYDRNGHRSFRGQARFDNLDLKRGEKLLKLA